MFRRKSQSQRARDQRRAEAHRVIQETGFACCKGVKVLSEANDVDNLSPIHTAFSRGRPEFSAAASAGEKVVLIKNISGDWAVVVGGGGRATRKAKQEFPITKAGLKETSEKLALLFSISLLHSLCQPRPKSWTPGQSMKPTQTSSGSKPIKTVPSEDMSFLAAVGVLLATPSNPYLSQPGGCFHALQPLSQPTRRLGVLLATPSNPYLSQPGGSVSC
ncbi:hypothetical protein ACOMHN_024124 [Nucella lapillus]